ncbi:hypothetical protein BJ508DRAFT_68004 [Ascobolus immersus RN42]|uniref:Mid2 domain-containing protein n=1 Tax=Ascobolus immersus RN42 TaxID=1160509 RepID=A0A3N4HGU7_ASCIM|nr:hypothetical protein BJ508DRAFT_68004 [Ascobolus immersus RN42]
MSTSASQKTRFTTLLPSPTTTTVFTTFVTVISTEDDGRTMPFGIYTTTTSALLTLTVSALPASVTSTPTVTTIYSTFKTTIRTGSDGLRLESDNFLISTASTSYTIPISYPTASVVAIVESVTSARSGASSAGYPKSVIIGASLGAGLGAILLGFLLLFLCRQQKQRRHRHRQKIEGIVEKEWSPSESASMNPFSGLSFLRRSRELRHASELENTNCRELEDTGKVELEAERVVCELGSGMSVRSLDKAEGGNMEVTPTVGSKPLDDGRS